MSQQTIYIKASESCVCTLPSVAIGDVLKVACSDRALLRKVKAIPLYYFQAEGERAFSILYVIDKILEQHPGLSVVNCGEEDFILIYRQEKVKSRALGWLKVGCVSLLVFFGSAFTIMAFHNDINIQGVFDRFYLQIIGVDKPKVSSLELSYVAGIGLGIVVFYNHISRKRLTKDPTPIEVELKKYKKDLNASKLDMADEEGKKEDVT